ncbi:hypothetical protein BVC80_717g12 [Macleaya cordata]|uniref:Conserved oligomeric Golgi complex subunit 1 n=1 Tax=Macleaya cordata TaxID=56857 RepID=A0A200PM57_MACCD|nr:hypothetical protein BVC80_717g12 [Macleaya cordata]
MRIPSSRSNDDAVGGFRDAESLFRSKPISEIRNVEASTKKEIEEKKEELRQLVGNRYRDLIDSADSIVLMKSSCESISANISMIDEFIRSLSTTDITSQTPKLSPNPARVSVYGIASRVKYLVDTPENIWGCLDESMFLEASGRYIRAKVVQGLVSSSDTDRDFLANFPLLQHQWQIVESFKGQISQRSRERLMDCGLSIGAYADALAAVAVIDELSPEQVLGLFLDSRKSWISQKLGTCASANCDSGSVISVFCEVVKIIQVSLAQVGELFLRALNDMPLFYKIILGSPPGSQLFGGLPNPEEEVRQWKLHREKLESVMLMLDKEFIAQTCSNWLRICGEETVSKINGRYLIDIINSGEELASAEKLIRESLDSRKVLEGSLEWLRSVFGSEIESPWNRLRELVLKDDEDLWDGIFENAFIRRMKEIIDSGFKDLSGVVNVRDSIRAIVAAPGGGRIDFQAYLNRPATGGGVWFLEPNVRKTGTGLGFKATTDENDFNSCLNSYFGPEVSQIRDAVDSRCQSILEDFLCFLGSQKAALRLRELAPYLQDKCYESVSTIVKEIEDELARLSSSMGNRKEEIDSEPPAIIVEGSLFIGRLLFAFRNHSSHIPLILGSPRLWVNETSSMMFDKSQSISVSSRISLDSPMRDSPKRQSLNSIRRQSSSSMAALCGVNDSSSPKLELLSSTLRDICIWAHSLWISWVSDELSSVLSKDLKNDDALSLTTSLRSWEETVVKQEHSNEGPLEMKIALPSMPSLYVTSFLFQACEEIHRIGGHILDKLILQKFALGLLERVVSMYDDFLSTLVAREPQVTERGILQILLDLRFTVDVLSGGDMNVNELLKTPKSKLPFKQNQVQNQENSVNRKRVLGLTSSLSQRLDPIDWATYEPYLWENEKQAYLRHAVLFGFFVQLNRMHTDGVRKLPSNTESNIMRCSTVPRFKYLPISAPALSSRGTAKSALPSSSEDVSSRSSWKSYPSGEMSQKLEFDDSSSFGVATPLFKSFMQVGTRFGESTLKLGSMLADGQVGRLKDKSAAAMSTFGDMLPVQAAGLLSSLTTVRSTEL